MAFLLSAALACARFSGNAQAGGHITIVSSVSRVDLKNGRIAGDKAGYDMDVPTMWSAYLTADRERLTNGAQPLEKLNFYYARTDGLPGAALFLSMNIYVKPRSAFEPGHRKLLETSKYIFTVHFPEENSLANKTDIAIYNNMREAADDQYLIGLIRLPKSDEKLYSHTVWVNGRQIGESAITDSSVTYLPIRGVCESLGYSVSWFPGREAIAIKRGDAREELSKGGASGNKGFTLVLSDGVAYVSSLFFTSVLKLSVEIDERGNVMLNENPQ